jgi:hypothetical protein
MVAEKPELKTLLICGVAVANFIRKFVVIHAKNRAKIHAFMHI